MRKKALTSLIKTRLVIKLKTNAYVARVNIFAPMMFIVWVMIYRAQVLSTQEPQMIQIMIPMIHAMIYTGHDTHDTHHDTSHDRYRLTFQC